MTTKKDNQVKYEILGTKGYDLLHSTNVHVNVGNDLICLESNILEVKDLLKDTVTITISINGVKLSILTINELNCSYIYLPVKSSTRYEKIKHILPTLRELIKDNLNDITLISPNIGFITTLWLESTIEKDNDKTMNISLSKIDPDMFIDVLLNTEKLLQDNNVSYPLQFKKLINYINNL